jgi:hypothetical protein
MYNHSKIYKLISSKTDLIYIGSTTKTLAQRIAQHKHDYKINKDNDKKYISSFKLLEIGECEILLLESVNCNNKDELRAKEREWIEKFKNICVNLRMPGRTTKGWREDNRERYILANKEYREKNYDRIRNKEIEYASANKEQRLANAREKITCICGGITVKGSKARHEQTTKHQTFLKSQESQALEQV